MTAVIGLLRRLYLAMLNPPSVPKAASPLKIGILGAANVAHYALVESARSHPDVQVYAVAARDTERARKFAEKHHIAKWYGGPDGYQELLDDAAIDAVYVPLPNALHYEWTMKALASGKHVLVEKPGADTAEEVRRMFELADRKGLVLLEALHYRFHPAIQRVKEIVDSGELGNIKEMSAIMNVPKGLIPDGDIRLNHSLGGGGMMDGGCYSLSCVRYLASSDPTAVISAKAMRYPGDARIDTATSADLLFPPSVPGADQVKASIQCDMRVPHILGIFPRLPAMNVRVICERGYVELVNYTVPVIYHYITVAPDGGEKRTEKAYSFSPGTSRKGETWWTTYRYQLEAFVDKVRGRTPQTWVSAEDSIQNLFWMEKVYDETGLGSRPQSSFQFPVDN